MTGIATGLIGLVVAVLCAVGFVVSAVRADERARTADPPGTSGMRGAPRVWALAAVTVAAASVLWLLFAVVETWQR